ncbi:hypothetical protein ISS42_02730 [Candidatus Shapirobacteria bacterium]|nr:hypothetical protein [Candidatus Shapirobacteria bacterium]
MKKKKKDKPRSIWIAEVGPKAKVLVKEGKQVEVGDILALKERKIVKKLLFPYWLKASLGSWAKGGEKVVGEKVEVKEVIFEQTSFPRRKLTWISTVKGELVSLNEKKGYLEVLTGKEEEKLISPISGTVIQTGKGKIQISFLAQEFKGAGLGQGVGWGKLTILKDQSLTSLSSANQGQVLVAEEISGPLVEKGAALGVAAFIGFQKQADLEESSLPVLIFLPEKGTRVTRAELAELIGQYCFVSPAHGQVLVCLEG